jgi:hypothetical protein
MKAPRLPFPNFKWRWAALMPTEQLNDPRIFRGVLEVLNRYDRYSKADPALAIDFAKIPAKNNLNLSRTGQRGLLRNSGQYWQALDVIEPARGQIRVTELGKMLATGQITLDQFAARTVRTLVLPNPRVMDPDEVEVWQKNNLEIRPLQLVMEVLRELWLLGSGDPFITPKELISILIPMSGTQASVNEIASAITAHRGGKLDVSGWPDCTPEVNDRRMAKEFLLFLEYYGFLESRDLSAPKDEKRYYLTGLARPQLLDFLDHVVVPLDASNTLGAFKNITPPDSVIRARINRTVLNRPKQAEFREAVLNAHQGTCLVTGCNFESVLEAAHIVPVSDGGTDDVSNGLCLRADIHILFDSDHLRIRDTGETSLSTAAQIGGYGAIVPARVVFPKSVNEQFIRLRF